jgi:hypothetical protein
MKNSQTGGQRYSDTSPFSIPWWKWLTDQHSSLLHCIGPQSGDPFSAQLLQQKMVYSVGLKPTYAVMKCSWGKDLEK